MEKNNPVNNACITKTYPESWFHRTSIDSVRSLDVLTNQPNNIILQVVHFFNGYCLFELIKKEDYKKYFPKLNQNEI